MSFVVKTACAAWLLLSWPQEPVRLGGWEFRVQKLPPPAAGDASPWRAIGLLGPGDLLPGYGLSLRTHLPQAYPDGAQLLVPGSASTLTLYLENEPIYRYGQAHGFTWHLVPLPSGHGGQWIQLWLPRPVPGSVSLENCFLIPPGAFSGVFKTRLAARLRLDLPLIALGMILSTAGIAAFALFGLRWKTRDWPLFAFGWFSALYGLRLLATSFTAALLLRVPPGAVAFFIAIVTYTILIPWILFVDLTFGRGWRSSIRWMLYAVSTLAIIEVVSDVVRRAPLSMGFENNVAVILSLAVLIPNLYWVRRRHIPGLRVTGAGLLVFAAFVLNANLGRFSMRPSNFDLEPLGFLVFLCCLGYVAVRRSIAAEQRLTAIEQELETARRIQASILPRKPPELPGLDVAARYLPMTAVAGDFYDFLVVDGARLGILVADVSGHGVPAALVASMVKVAFASQAPHASEPARVLSGLNEILSGKLEGQFVTAGYAFLDLATRSLVCAGAGHPPLLLVRKADHRIIGLQDNGLFLGPFRHATYRDTRHSVEAGDRLLLYTDGILEAAGPSAEPFGDRQFPKFIHGHAHLAASDFADALLQTLSRWSNQHNGGGQDDDLTLIIVDITSPQPPISNPPLL